MPRLVQQLPSVILAVDVQQKRAEGAHLLHRHRNAVDTAGGFPLRGDAALQDQFVAMLKIIFREPGGRVRFREHGADQSALGSGTHQLAARAPAQHGADGVDHDAFARAGLTRQDVEAGGEADVGPLDDRDIFNVKIRQHYSRSSISEYSFSAEALSRIATNAVSSPAMLPTRFGMSRLSSMELAASARPGRVLMTIRFCATA